MKSNLKSQKTIKTEDKKKKQLVEVESNRSNLKLTETSIIDKKKNLDIKSNASNAHGKSSVIISENINESFDNTKMYLKLDKIVEKSSGISKELTESIENQDYEKKLLNLLKDTEKIVTLNHIRSPKEEGGKYEYVEKSLLNKLKKDNDDLKKRTTSLIEQLAELNKAFKKVEGEYNFTRQLYNSQKKQKEENESKIENLSQNINHFKAVNENLKQDFTNFKLDKDIIYRTLLSFVNKIDEKYSNDMKELISSYNNQYFLTKLKAKDEAKVEVFLGQICSLDKKISKINFEISCLKKLLVDDKKKNK